MSTAIAELPDLYEVIDGEIVEKEPMSVKANACAAIVNLSLGVFGTTKSIGMAYPETLIQMPYPIDRDRRPDVIFVSYAKWPKGKAYPDDRAWDIIPDLCVEVVSPTDQADNVREKVEEYFEAGIPAVWVVYPQRELVDVYETPATVHRTFRRSDTLTGSGVLSGFSLPLSELFLR